MRHTMTNVEVADLKPDSFFKEDLKIDKLFLVTSVACPLTAEVLKSLKDWNFDKFILDGNICEASLTMPQPKVMEEKSVPNISEEKKQEIKSGFEEVSFDGDLVVNKKPAVVAVEQPVPPPKPHVKVDYSHIFLDALTKARSMPVKSESDRMEEVQVVYDGFSEYITAIYTRYATHRELNYEEISKMVQELCTYERDHRRYLLRITPTLEARNKNFLVSHSMRSTIIAIAIGLQIHMPPEKLVELGVACMLHEIGMIRLPPQLYMNSKPLSAIEYAQMTTHTVLGYNVVKDANFPLSIQLGVLEHHERETGNGYPRHLTSDKISLYAKIIAVACSYEAISAPRHFRDAHTTFDAIVELLKNANHQYDDTVVKALLYTVSLYPIGAYVYLANGKIAQVVDVNPANQRNPIVQIIGEKELDGSPKTVQTNDAQFKIIRVMNKTESDDVLKAISSQENAQTTN